MDPKVVVERLFAAETRGDVEGIVALMHDEVVLHLSCRKVFGPDAVTDVRGKDAARRLYEEDVPRRGPAFSLRATRMIAEATIVCAEWIARCGPSGQDIRRGVDVFDVQGGTILRGAVYVDLATIPARGQT